MPAFSVDSSLDIHVPHDKVHAALVDFKTWPIWSPWLYTERDATVNYHGTAGEPGHGYDWQGKKTGAGGMSLKAVHGERIDYDLQFLKPFKSQADVSFVLQQLDNQITRVTWDMKSSLPFFMFWLKSSMVGMIRSDFRRGLLLLKDFLELGSASSKTVLTEKPVEVPASYYIGKQSSVTMAEIGESMESNFSELLTATQSADLDITATPFSIYTRMDMRRDQCTCIAALPIAETAQSASLKPELIMATRPACTALKAVHTGPYRHLGSAWACLMGEARHRKLKPSKASAPFEIYVNDPEGTPEKELQTELYLPIRS